MISIYERTTDDYIDKIFAYIEHETLITIDDVNQLRPQVTEWLLEYANQILIEANKAIESLRSVYEYKLDKMRYGKE